GTERMIAVGGLVLFLGAEMASRTSAEDSLGVFIGLFLIGLGWSFGLIAGSALLTSSFAIEHRVTVQGAADLVMVGSGASAGVLAGLAFERSGFATLSQWSGVAALTMVVAAAWALLKTTRRRRPALS
ncbi:MAG: MFS transporter, partial [Acidimicrobiales bacterium]